MGCAFILLKTYKTGKYARYLADVFYGDGEVFLNRELLEVGLAGKY